MKYILKNQFLLVFVGIAIIGCKTKNKNAETTKTNVILAKNTLLKNAVF